MFDTSLESQQMAKDIENVFGTSLESQKMDKYLECVFYNCAMQLLELSLACHVQKIRSNQLNIFFLSRPECRVLSMSLYPDLIHTLSRFYPAFIQIFL